MRPGTSLFVAGLPEDVNEGALIHHFERIDRTIQIRNINILRAYGTMKSHGTAIIDFATSEDAQKALDEVNYTEMSGKEIQLMWYQIGGIKDRITGNIFVKNLPLDFRSKELYELFSAVGRVVSCRVRYNINGTCKGYGYVQFENKETADKALKEMNGREIRGYKIDVGPFKSRDNRNSSINMYNNLFVKCIPKKFTNEDLKSLFSSCGEIVSAVIIKERAEDKENKGFGFVCFKRAEDAKTAEEKLKNAQIEGQSLHVCRALPLEEHRKKMREERFKLFKDCNVYVKNLPDDINDETLKNEFGRFGHVISARVMLEPRQDPATGNTEMKSKGYGFVCFSNKEEAKKAVQGVAEQQLFGRTVVAAIAEKKEDRMTKLAHGMYQMPIDIYSHMYRNARPRRSYVEWSVIIGS
jgi:polyadenylate-binding protein